jgi:glucose-6-phosphate 1-dehydrogenase
MRTGINANYEPGSWGPKSADELLARDGRAWHNG